MKLKRMLVIIMTLVLVSCQDTEIKECQMDNSCELTTETGEDAPVENDDPIIVETPDQVPDPIDEDHDHDDEPTEPTIPNPSLVSFNHNVEFFKFDPEDVIKVNTALSELVAVIKSEEFKYEILHHTYKGEETFVDNKGMSNAQIYQAILDGAEVLLPEVDKEMDLELQLYYKNNGVIGYTYPSKLRIYMNTKFFNRFDTEEVAGNLVHEWLHKLGFKHSSRRTASRRYSVPYAVGYLVEDLIVEMRKQGRL